MVLSTADGSIQVDYYGSKESILVFRDTDRVEELGFKY